MLTKKKCRKCGKFFYANGNTCYCDACRKNVTVHCSECGKEFILSRKQLYTWQRDLNNTHLYFCSLECRKKSDAVVKKIKDTYKKRTGYDNPSQDPEVKKKKEDTCLKNHKVKYYVQCQEFWDKLKQTNLELYGVEYSAQRPEVISKIMATKEKNGWRSSEEKLFEERLQALGLVKNKHFYAEHWDASYPYCCDFYIPSRHLYIELNCFPTHGQAWCNMDNKEDIERIHELNKLKDTQWMAKGTLEVWGNKDIKKRATAKQNKLNYVVLWNAKDIEDWFSLGMPNGQDWKHEYSWKDKCNQNHKTIAMIKRYKTRDIIYQYDTTGKILNAFWGVQEAAKQTGISEYTIKRNLNKKHGLCNNQFYFGTEKLSKKYAYSHFVAITLEKTIYQYNKKGKLISTFNDLKEAALKTGLNKNTISMACIQIPKTYKGFVFSRTKLTKNEVLQRYAHKPSPKEYTVYQYDLDGHLLRTFNNLKEAATATGIKRGTLAANCINASNICAKKYIFSKIKLTKSEIKKRVTKSRCKSN